VHLLKPSPGLLNLPVSLLNDTLSSKALRERRRAGSVLPFLTPQHSWSAYSLWYAFVCQENPLDTAMQLR
jgi:hypothetical protein